MVHILVADDDDAIRELLYDYLSSKGYQVEQARNGQEVLQKLRAHSYHALLLDNRMPDLDGLSVLRQMKAAGITTPVILITAHSTSSVAVDSAQLGAFDYLPKPLNLGKVEETLQRLLEHTRLTRQLAGFEESTASDNPLITSLPGVSRSIQKLREQAMQVAATEHPVYIYGECGVGKAFLARAIHDHSPRQQAPFVPFECNTEHPDELEIDLFGQQRDPADTSTKLKKGVLELASGGTLFLADVTALPLPLQQQLIQTFQTHQFRRLGGSKDILLDVKLIVSSRSAPQQAVADGQLHEGWLGLLGEATLRLPPLRERPEDIPMLIQALLTDLNMEQSDLPPSEITHEAVLKLQQYEWLCNVRELKEVVLAARNRAGHMPITPEHLTLSTAS